MYKQRNYCSELSVLQVLATALHVVYSSFYTQLQGWPHTSDFSHSDYCAAQMKHMVNMKVHTRVTI